MGEGTGKGKKDIACGPQNIKYLLSDSFRKKVACPQGRAVDPPKSVCNTIGGGCHPMLQMWGTPFTPRRESASL